MKFGQPHNDKEPWKVFATFKGGTLLSGPYEDDIELFSILDSDLENLEEYKNYQLPKT